MIAPSGDRPRVISRRAPNRPATTTSVRGRPSGSRSSGNRVTGRATNSTRFSTVSPSTAGLNGRCRAGNHRPPTTVASPGTTPFPTAHPRAPGSAIRRCCPVPAPGATTTARSATRSATPSPAARRVARAGTAAASADTRRRAGTAAPVRPATIVRAATGRPVATIPAVMRRLRAVGTAGTRGRPVARSHAAGTRRPVVRSPGARVTGTVLAVRTGTDGTAVATGASAGTAGWCRGSSTNSSDAEGPGVRTPGPSACAAGAGASGLVGERLVSGSRGGSGSGAGRSRAAPWRRRRRPATPPGYRSGAAPRPRDSPERRLPQPGRRWPGWFRWPTPP